MLNKLRASRLLSCSKCVNMCRRSNCAIEWIPMVTLTIFMSSLNEEKLRRFTEMKMNAGDLSYYDQRVIMNYEESEDEELMWKVKACREECWMYDKNRFIK